MRFVVVASAFLVGVIATSTAFAQMGQTRANSSANLFGERVAAYMQLRRAVVDAVLEQGFNPNGDGGMRFRQKVAAAVRDARRHSQPGDIFCQEVASRLRQMVQNAVSNRPLQDQREMLSEVPRVSRVRVNAFYPAGEPLATMPSLLLQQLDPLPPELQYRFLADALILLDIDTALIIDVIPDVLRRRS
jgi:hypothetical protein